VRDLLLSYYGDDFTGSTDALEALSLAGVRTVLFLRPPSPAAREHFENVQAVGLAGTGRSLSPQQMDRDLPPLFGDLRSLGAPVSHYKTCSTFDSSPEIGSIGRAIDIGAEVFGSPFVPLLVGVPKFGRYCAFGNLFARAGISAQSEAYRLDRHPTMSRHPVTPMTESDLRLHLAPQTAKRVALFDVLQYELDAQARAERLAELLAEDPDIVLFDLLTPAQLEMVGALIWERASREAPLFAVGSSGVQYALAAHWRAADLIGPAQPFAPLEPADQVLAVSGSCSPVTERQLREAQAGDYRVIALDTAALIDPQRAEAARAAAVGPARAALAAGHSVIVHSCLGPHDPRIPATGDALAALGYSAAEARLHGGGLLGNAIGQTLQALLEGSQVRRVIVAGGDTSGHVAAALGIEALEMIAPLAPGGPLCRAYAPASPSDGLEIAFKGGQVGLPDYFATALHGEARITGERGRT
jgi:3-oxoisoapionate kinase